MQGNILVIDDEATIRQLMSRIIALEGFIVEQAATLKEGKKYYRKMILMLCYAM